MTWVIVGEDGDLDPLDQYSLTPPMGTVVTQVLFTTVRKGGSSHPTIDVFFSSIVLLSLPLLLRPSRPSPLVQSKHKRQSYDYLLFCLLLLVGWTNEGTDRWRESYWSTFSFRFA